MIGYFKLLLFLINPVRNVFSVKDGISLNHIPYTRNRDKCLILGNGPSLKEDLPEISRKRGEYDIICVNYFPIYDVFFDLKPEYFIFTDLGWWAPKVHDTIRMKIANHVREKSLTSYGVFDRLFFRPKEIEMWRTIGMPENKLIPVHGLTYMDVALTANTLENKVRVLTPFFKNKTKEEIENLKLILLIHNNTMTGCIHPNGSPKSAVQNSKEYGIILNQMNQYAEEHDCYVITKIGRKSSTLIENEFIKSIIKY